MYLCYSASQSRRLFRRRYQSSVLVWLRKEFVTEKLLLRCILCSVHSGDCLFSGWRQVRPGTLLLSMLGPQQGTCPSRGASYSPFGWLSSWDTLGQDRCPAGGSVVLSIATSCGPNTPTPVHLWGASTLEGAPLGVSALWLIVYITGPFCF